MVVMVIVMLSLVDKKMLVEVKTEDDMIGGIDDMAIEDVAGCGAVAEYSGGTGPALETPAAIDELATIGLQVPNSD